MREQKISLFSVNILCKYVYHQCCNCNVNCCRKHHENKISTSLYEDERELSFNLFLSGVKTWRATLKYTNLMLSRIDNMDKMPIFQISRKINVYEYKLHLFIRYLHVCKDPKSACAKVSPGPVCSAGQVDKQTRGHGASDCNVSCDAAQPDTYSILTS